MAPGSDGSHLDRRVRLVLGDQLPRWHEASDLTAAWVGRLELHLASCVVRGQGPTRRLSCGSFDPLTTAAVLGCPSLPPPLRTQPGPRDRLDRSPPSTCSELGSTTPAAGWSLGGVGDHRPELTDKPPGRENEPSTVRIAASRRRHLAGEPLMAGLGTQGSSPLTHQLLGHEWMQHRGLLRN